MKSYWSQWSLFLVSFQRGLLRSWWPCCQEIRELSDVWSFTRSSCVFLVFSFQSALASDENKAPKWHRQVCFCRMVQGNAALGGTVNNNCSLSVQRRTNLLQTVSGLSRFLKWCLRMLYRKLYRDGYRKSYLFVGTKFLRARFLKVVRQRCEGR